jgi:pimeloyl-ACP methyl ester carboxylesterase
MRGGGLASGGFTGGGPGGGGPGGGVEEFAVPVSGGALATCRWPGDGPVVLAVHGITANALAWAPLAGELAGRVRLVAPDLRGRAGSRSLPGPYGLAAHADDLVAVLDFLGVESAPLVGHSMGGFVAALAALRHPDRFDSVLLVDGGVALPVPDGGDIDAVLEAVIGPAIRRLTMDFPGTVEYLDFWRAHPAIGPWWRPEIEPYLLRDLIGEPPALRSSCVLDAIRADARDTLRDPDTLAALNRVTCPVTLLWAARGMRDEAQGLYDDGRLDAAGVDRDRVAVHPVPGVNHYTILLEPAGARAVAEHIR